MKRMIIGLTFAGPVLAAAIGCSSAPATTSGAEHFTGSVSGAAAETNSPTFHLTFTGPVTATGSQVLSGSPPGKGQTHSFPTSAGTLTVLVTNAPTTHQTLANPASCAGETTTTVDYNVDGAKSTGKWAGATGSGVVNVNFKADLPKLANGTCNTSSNAAPVPGTASASFTGGGPVTIKS